MVSLPSPLASWQPTGGKRAAACQTHAVSDLRDI
jgi:hypothetical protein